MKSCLDIDQLVSLGSALDWDPEEGLLHLAECDRCRTQLNELAALQHALVGQIQPEPGFSDRVVGSVLRKPHRNRARSFRIGIVGVVNAALAGLVSFFAIALGMAGLSQTAVEPPGVIASLIAAASTLWWNGTQRSGSPGIRR